MAMEKHVQKIAREYVKRLGRDLFIEQAFLTGSWARGSYLEDSDVDLIIISDDFKRMELPERLVYLQRSWKDRLPLEAFGYTTGEFRRLKMNSSYVNDAVQHGIKLTSTRLRQVRTKAKETKTTEK